MTSPSCLLLCAATTLLGAPPELSLRNDSVQDVAAIRSPVAAAWLKTDKLLVVANSRSGSVSLVDVPERQVRQELSIGKQLSDCAVVNDSLLLATDQAAQELIAVSRHEGKLVVVARTKVSSSPVSIAFASDSNKAVVAGLWSRRLDLIAIEHESTRDVRLTVSQSIDLPFIPRQTLLLPDGEQLVVTAAFDGQLAIVNIRTGKVVSSRSFQAHNIGRLAWNEEHQQLLVPQQILLETAATDENNIQWGALMKNVVRVINHNQLLDPAVKLTTATRVVSIGSDGEGHADPTAILARADGQWLVASGGTNCVLRLDTHHFAVASGSTGERPVQLLPANENNEVIAVNQFADSLTILHSDSLQSIAKISLGQQPKLTPADRGERLFYSAALSYEGWMSCHSCHTNGHSNNLLADTQGDGSYGAPKRTLSLLGVRDTDRWAWNGEIKDLQQQVRKSIETTLHGQASADDVFDLTAYLHTLDPPPPRQPLTLDAADRRQGERGKAVFLQQRCDRCHVPALTYTSHDAYDVGLSDEHGQRKFNPPSLRGVGHASKFFHDQRATSLEDVFQVHGHQVDDTLNEEQIQDLLRFLRSL